MENLSGHSAPPAKDKGYALHKLEHAASGGDAATGSSEGGVFLDHGSMDNPIAPSITHLLLSAEERYQVEHGIQLESERERYLLSVDLHDGVCQQLSGIAFMAGSLAQTLSKKGLQQEEQYLRELTRLIRNAIENAKDVARELHPVDKDGKGLTAAVNQLVAQIRSDSVSCDLDWPAAFEVADNQVALQLYHIIKDAVCYAAQYAGASRIRIGLCQDATNFTFSVCDNGSGFFDSVNEEAAKALQTMCHRAHCIGSMIEMESRPEGGNIVRCILSNRGRNAPAIEACQPAQDR